MELIGPAGSPRIDEPCDLRVTGLEPGERVRIEVECEYPGLPWVASATFEADGGGGVSVVGQDPIDGDWVGDPSGQGPWWSGSRIDRPPASEVGRRVPVTATVKRADASSASTSWVRRRADGPVRTIDGGSERSITKVFLPTEVPVRCGLVVFGGSEGGLPRTGVEELLAAAGIAVCLVQYFGSPLDRTDLLRVPVEAALDGVEALEAAAPGVPIAAQGTSRGGELALLAASTWPDRISGAFVVSGSGVLSRGLVAFDVVDEPAWTLAGVDLPFWGEGDPPLIEVERIDGPVVTVLGLDDQLWDSKLLTGHLVERRSRRPHPGDAHHAFEGAGHYFHEYPGIPAFDPSEGWQHPETGEVVLLGGNLRSTALARGASWAALLRFCDAIADSR